jgi:hypothetical protein
MNFISETPWWFPTILIAAGIALFIAGNNRLDKQMKTVGLVLAMLAILVGALSWFFESDREIVGKRTKALVAAIAGQDWTTTENLLHPEASVLSIRGRPLIMFALQQAVGRWNVKSARVVQIDVKQQGEGATSTIQVMSDSGATGTNITNWSLEWEKTSAGWQMTDVQPLGGPGISESDISSVIRRSAGK